MNLEGYFILSDFPVIKALAKRQHSPGKREAARVLKSNNTATSSRQMQHTRSSVNALPIYKKKKHDSSISQGKTNRHHKYKY